MNKRTEVLETLQRNAETLRALGATALFMFGSAARDEMGPDSDIDLFIDYDRETDFDLFAQVRLQQHLQTMLHRDVDLTTRGGLHPRLKSEIERTSIQVY